MSEIDLQNLPVALISDGKGTQIRLDGTYPANTFFLKPSSYSDEHWWMREVKFIQVTDGISQGADAAGHTFNYTDLQTGKFYVVRDVFMEQLSSWYELKRVGINWKSHGKQVNAKQVKQWIQSALLPFKISSRDCLDIYQQLDLYCSQPDTQVEPLAIVSAQDLNTHEYKRPPAIVEGFLYAGVVLFAAPPKTGKSFLALDLACCVAEGSSFWNFPTAAGDVLYLDLEGTEWRTNDRLPKVGRKKAPERLSHAYRSATIDTGLIQQLEEWINSVNSPKLIIIDTLQHVKGRVARGENEYAADTRFMKPLHDLAIAKGIAIVTITHTRKSNGFALDDPFDAIMGSAAQYGNADAAWLIGGKRGEDKKTFSANGRDFESVSFEIERGADGRWIFNGSSEEQQEVSHKNEYQNDMAVAVIREQLSNSGGLWRVTAQELLETAAKSTGVYLELDATRMGRRIRELAPDLLKYDDILVRWPNKHGGKDGRLITFEQRGFADGE